MTDQEIVELPKVWVVGGDGGMGDIGYQNTSKVILQNRPNVKALMLDTQVYSNTGGQNSDSSPMLGGSDMNVFGSATQGKNTEKKTVAETFLAGHGSPFVAQVSMANAPKLYRAILDGLEYRGTMFLQASPPASRSTAWLTTWRSSRRSACATRAACRSSSSIRARARAIGGLDIKGNPSVDLDWYETKSRRRASRPVHGGALVRHRSALPKPPEEGRSRSRPQKMVPLENMLVRITQQDVVYRRYLDPKHRAFIPDFGVYIKVLEEQRQAGVPRD